MEEFGITYPNGPDLGGRIGQDYGLTGVPETFFIDRSGQVRYTKLGPLTEPELRRQLDALLEQQSDGQAHAPHAPPTGVVAVLMGNR